MCRLYGVTRAGYYQWRSRERSERERRNEALLGRIRRVHEQSRGIYGSPRVHRALRSQGVGASENRVARVMRAEGIKARVATIRYTNRKLQGFYDRGRNEQLELELSGPDQVWVGDITYLKVGPVYRYLAVVMDKYSRKILGWAYGRTYPDESAGLAFLKVGALLATIFAPYTPLHDGAVIIDGNNIVAAACILPLTQFPVYDPAIGTRHRAAIGLSEETDAVVVVVSEETGQISLAVGGRLS